MNLIFFLFRIVLFVGFTLSFVVLFEHGPAKFADSFVPEVRQLASEVGVVIP